MYDNDKTLQVKGKELEDAGELNELEGGGPTVEERPPEEVWQEQDDSQPSDPRAATALVIAGATRKYYDEPTGQELDPSRRSTRSGSRVHAQVQKRSKSAWKTDANRYP